MRLLLPLLIVLLTAGAAAAAEPAALATARERYNTGDFEGAISAAAVARNIPTFADAASLVIARAHLERYRQSADPAELSTARQTLFLVKPDHLSPRDQVDLFIGLGQTLYLGELFGASADLFETALSRGGLLDPPDRRQLLDWWATALDREAQSRIQERRPRVFERILVRMEDELRIDPFDPVASYWVAVAARGIGDPDRAWNAAVAAWVRTSLAAEPESRSETSEAVHPEAIQALRGDLDRLVTQALVVERARLRPAREQQDAAAALRAEWDLVKEQWK